MTQAFNLSQFANKLNTSGQADLSTAVTGTLPIANGGTGTSTPSLVAGTGISISGSFPNQTVTSTVTGGVTSLNGQTGAITDTTRNAIGSYAMVWSIATSSNPPVLGSTYAASGLYTLSEAGSAVSFSGAGFSGTWRCMNGWRSNGTNAGNSGALMVRIS